jgi:hypothetical protein
MQFDKPDQKKKGMLLEKEEIYTAVQTPIMPLNTV